MAWALHPPQAPIRGVRPSSSIFLAYILQQYRDTPCARCRGAAAAPGAEAGPVPRLQPWHQWPRSRRRLGTGCGAQPPLDYGGHPPSRGGPISPLLHPGEQGALGELPAEAVLPQPCDLLLILEANLATGEVPRAPRSRLHKQGVGAGAGV